MKRSIVTLILMTIGYSSAQAGSGETGQLEKLMSDLSDEQKMEIIVNSGSQLEVWNFDTQKMEEVSRPDKATPEEIQPFVAPIDQIREFYRHLIDEGTSPIVAMYKANVIAYQIIAEDASRIPSQQ